MRILMLSWEYPPHIVGGLGAHVGALVPALARAGAQVHVVTPRWAGGPPEEKVLAERRRSARSHRVAAKRKARVSSAATVYRVPPPVVGMGNFIADVHQTNLNMAERGQRLIDECGDFDLIHAHDWLVAFAAESLKRINKCPLIATIHATERGRGRGALNGEMAHAINGTEWWLTYEAWRVICASQFMADEVETYFQTPPDKIDVIPNGVDTTPFDSLEHQDLADFRTRWARNDERIIFSVGRLVQEKGAQLIVEAAPRVLAELPNCKFIIAGTGWLSDQLKRRVWELGVSDRVDIAGFISDEDRNRLLKVADVAVFPSLYEPFGIVALEAMAAKCPVIVSSVGGLAEVVRHDETGVTVYPDNIESLAWGIVYSLKRPELAQIRAERAYRIVKSEYSWDRIAARTLQVYDRVIRARAKTKW